MTLLKQFFAEANGKWSNVRLLSFLIAVSAIAIAFIAVFRDAVTTELVALVSTMLGIGIGGKVIQKGRES